MLRAIPLGLVTVTTAGTPVPITAALITAAGDFRPPSGGVHKIEAYAKNGNAGVVFVKVSNEAAKLALEVGADPDAARRSAAKPFQGFRFHDLRHQSITEMAEAGIPEAAMQSIAGHLSKKMLDHYSHVRMAAKRTAVEALGGGGLIVLEITPNSTHHKA